MRPSRRSASRPAPSASGRSTPSGARSCATPASPSSRSPTGRRSSPTVAPWADEADLPPARHRHLAAQGRARRLAPPTSPPIPRRVRSPARSSPTRPPSRRRGGLDFDDLILRAIDRLEGDPALLARWRGRCRELLVDEVQDVDRAQLGSPCCWPRRRTGSSSSATTTSRSTAGDSPTSVGSSASRRSCRVCGGSTSRSTTAARGPVVERAVRLVEHNGERFAKAIRAGPAATGRLVLAPDAADETVRLERAIRSLAGRRVDPRDPRPDEPRAAAGGRRRARARAAVPRAADRPAARVAARRRPARLARSGRRRRPSLPLLVALGRVRDRVRRRPAAARGRDGAPRLGGRPFADLAGLRRGDRATRARPRRPAPRRRAADPRHGPRDQGPRVRPRHRHRHGGRPVPERRAVARPTTRSARTRRSGVSATSRGPGRGGR